MRKAIAVSSFLFAISLIWSFPSHATQVVVSPGKSIKNAVNEAAAGDTIWIKHGQYVENDIQIQKPLVIQGEDYPTIDASGGEEIFIISSDSVFIEGLHLMNVSVSFLHEPAAIRLVHVRYNTIRNNRIDNCFFGIYLQYTTNSVIEGNTVTGANVDEAHAGNAIHIWKGDHIQVKNNLVQHHRDGIYFEFVNNSIIDGNRSLNNLRYGLHFMFSNDDHYTNNLFQHNGAGVAVMFSKRIEMDHNTFELNWGGSSYGILLKEISHGKMNNNLFKQNTVGIYAEGATSIQIVDNDFIGNGKAIDMKGNCIQNSVVHNNFEANTFEAYTNTRSNLNTYDNNYWSQYKGYDLDQDGIGDVPYRPVNLMALVTNDVPAAYILLHSMLAGSLDMFERIFPQLIPETLIDKQPLMRPLTHD